MTIDFRAVSEAEVTGATRVVAVTEEGLDALDEVDPEQLDRRGFKGKRDEAVVLAGSTDTVVAGLGPAVELGADALRRAAAAATRAAPRVERVAVAVPVPEGSLPAAAAQAWAEGSALAAYRFDRYKSEPDEPRLAEVVLTGAGVEAVEEMQAGLDRGRIVVDAVVRARDLVNEPGGELTATALADAAVEIGDDRGVAVDVMDEGAIAEAGLGGLLGVNRGSTQPPRLIRLDHRPAEDAPTVALVGKGVTFDAGGLDIKTTDGMATMKSDMGGAAAVLGAFSALVGLEVETGVTGWIPATDNMLGPDATRPGDVLRIRGGQSVEVTNTDAEGRLILADALTLAGEESPDAMVDLATLTGGCVVALGPAIAGLMGNDEEWLSQVEGAGERAGEPLWRLPLPGRYRTFLDSDVADLKNSGVRWASALTAGLFLSEFVPDGTPWAHLDIAGPAFRDEDDGEHTKGGTGFGVRTLLELLGSFSPLG